MRKENFLRTTYNIEVLKSKHIKRMLDFSILQKKLALDLWFTLFKYKKEWRVLAYSYLRQKSKLKIDREQQLLKSLYDDEELEILSSKTIMDVVILHFMNCVSNETYTFIFRQLSMQSTETLLQLCLKMTVITHSYTFKTLFQNRPFVAFQDTLKRRTLKNIPGQAWCLILGQITDWLKMLASSV